MKYHSAGTIAGFLFRRLLSLSWKQISSMARSCRKASAIVLIAASISIDAGSQEYEKVFGRDWEKAENFVTENQSWIRPLLSRYKVDFAEAVAIVFPELVRYSALRDKIEITLLKALYINVGRDYADFSIGQFQMKPSFAEKVREEMLLLPGRKYARLLTDTADINDPRRYRASIVSDLENPEKQLGYLILFIRICEKRIKDLPSGQEERISLLAAAYNSGFWKSRVELDRLREKRFFTTKLVGGDYYSYSDISVYWFRKYRGSGQN